VERQWVRSNKSPPPSCRRLRLLHQAKQSSSGAAARHQGPTREAIRAVVPEAPAPHAQHAAGAAAHHFGAALHHRHRQQLVISLALRLCNDLRQGRRNRAKSTMIHTTQDWTGGGQSVRLTHLQSRQERDKVPRSAVQQQQQHNGSVRLYGHQHTESGSHPSASTASHPHLVFSKVNHCQRAIARHREQVTCVGQSAQVSHIVCARDGGGAGGMRSESRRCLKSSLTGQWQHGATVVRCCLDGWPACLPAMPACLQCPPARPHARMPACNACLPAMPARLQSPPASLT
jgi:hypothetical protein